MNKPFKHDTPFSDEAPFGHNHGPMLTGSFAPVFKEEVLDQLPIEGTIPADLNGVYLRNGPNPRFEPKGAYHAFDGDGMIHGLHFQNGALTYRNKWVRTEGWLKNDKAGQENYWGVMNTLKGRKDMPMNDVANTDVIGHGGKALATWYLAGQPYLLDPISLETIGVGDYTRAPGHGMSAHPKVDEETGDLMFFDYFDHHPYMSYGVVNAQGELVHHVPIELPGDRLPHDMGITENYSILHDLPVFHCPEAMKAGRHKILFDASLPTRFGVISRFGASETITWFNFTPCFLYHVVNCWEEGDEIVMIACRYMPIKNADGTIDEARTAKRIALLGMDARLWCYRMNLRTGDRSEACLNPDLNVEFPGFNSTYTGRKSQWAYLVDHDPNILRWTGLRKFNTDTGECVGAWSDGHEHCWYSEPWFAPADKPRDEDHGYVIIMRWHDEQRTQEIQIFDAKNINHGPIARIKLPHRIPAGFHACWMKPQQIETWPEAIKGALK